MITSTHWGAALRNSSSLKDQLCVCVCVGERKARKQGRGFGKWEGETRRRKDQVVERMYYGGREERMPKREE